MRPAALGAAVVTTALVLLPRTSAAQKTEKVAGGEQVLLLYEDNAPPGCPTQADFEAEVSKLTSKAHFTRQRPARRVRIELAGRGSDVLGRLTSGEADNQSSREVRGKDCREVSSALAIAVALTIDPEALGVSDGAAAPEAAAPTPAAEPRPPTKPGPRPKRLPLPAPAPKPAPPPKLLHWGLGAGLTLENAWAPQMRPGTHAFGVLGVGERLRVNLGLVRFFIREVDAVSFGGWFGHGSLSVNLAVLGALRPFGTLGFEAGVVDASGRGLALNVTAQRPWQAGNAGLGLRFETDDFFLQLGGSLLVPISRQRYLLSDQQGEIKTFYEVPRFGLKQETSLGVFL